MQITTELTGEEQRACELIGCEFHNWLIKKAQKMLNIVMEQAVQKAVRGKSLLEIEEMVEKDA